MPIGSRPIVAAETTLQLLTWFCWLEGNASMNCFYLFIWIECKNDPSALPRISAPEGTTLCVISAFKTFDCSYSVYRARKESP